MWPNLPTDSTGNPFPIDERTNERNPLTVRNPLTDTGTQEPLLVTSNGGLRTAYGILTSGLQSYNAQASGVGVGNIAAQQQNLFDAMVAAFNTYEVNYLQFIVVPENMVATYTVTMFAILHT